LSRPLRQRKTKAPTEAVTPGSDVVALGGGLEGADRTSRTLASWKAPHGSADIIINRDKETADARAKDLGRNDGGTANVVAIHKNSIVGSEYRLAARPDLRTLAKAATRNQIWKDWLKEFQATVESRFGLVAESEKNWFDASRRDTFTGLIRLAVGGFVTTGEYLATVEWMTDPKRPYKTALQQISPSRLCNSSLSLDTPNLSRGVEIDANGQPLAYWIRSSNPGDLYVNTNWTWKRVPAETTWGRRQVIHIIDRQEPAQTRGIGDLVAVMETMAMAKQFRGVVLQNAIVNASYAAALESELPADVLQVTMGAGAADGGLSNFLGQYLSEADTYYNDAKNIKMDGVRIPQLFPGTKLNLQPVGTPGGVGTDFEQALMRYAAAGLGVSYEEFSRDYSDVSYSSGRLAMASTERYMNARKKLVADGLANALYRLWFEEEMNLGNIPLPPGVATLKDMQNLYYNEKTLFKEAISKARWIGASVGQVDAVKETQAAIMKINAGLSTRSIETNALGYDQQEVFEELAREQEEATELNLTFQADPTVQGKGVQQDAFAPENDPPPPKGKTK
jgi:lambda family phage portal protein